jgi:two-component system cell cycle response regulator DivK
MAECPDPESAAVARRYSLAGDENKALVAACDGYVSKPYSPRDLLAKVRAYLA